MEVEYFWLQPVGLRSTEAKNRGPFQRGKHVKLTKGALEYEGNDRMNIKNRFSGQTLFHRLVPLLKLRQRIFVW